MQVWNTLILALQLLSALVMIGLVLIQHGKGADMGASFGSGASGSLFGATGSANFLSRSTAVCAAVFFCSTLVLAYLGNTNALRAQSGGSVLDRAAPAASAAASGAIPGAIPGAAPGAIPATTPATTPGAIPGAAPAAVPAPATTAPAAAASAAAAVIPTK
jgi:preprotein translocase subunit SecG